MTRQLITTIMVALSTGLFFSSCRDGEKGDPGPAGVGYYKTNNGELSGTIYYKYPNGDTAIVPFSNKGFTSVTQSALYIDSSINNYGYNYYSFDITRIDPEDDRSFIRIACCNVSIDMSNDTCFTKPHYLRFGISKISPTNNSFFAFATMSDVYNGNLNYYNIYESDNLTITNYYLNPVSHRLTFDYEIVMSPNHPISNYRYDYTVSPIIKGSVDVTLKTTPSYLYYCGG
jgi:hypothetical protein